MDLSPRTEAEDAESVRRDVHRRRRRIIVALTAALVVVAGAVLYLGLQNATLFFRNVDEAIAEREELGDRRFRLQGRVIPASVSSESGVTTFQVVHNCAVAWVQHTTDPPELFQSPWIPVVLEGRWTEGAVSTVAGTDESFFLSDRMLVKHTNEYAADNGERVSAEPPDGFLDDCPFDAS